MSIKEVLAHPWGRAVNSTDSSKLPLYGSRPAAGFPAPGDDSVEDHLNIHNLLVKNPLTTFFVRVEGDSMEGAGIFSGDILVVDKSISPHSGSIVVAAIYGELVVKRYKESGGLTQLVSENLAYSPITLSGVEDVFVWGVVVGSVRQY